MGGEKATSQADFPPTSDERCMFKIIKYLLILPFQYLKEQILKIKIRTGHCEFKQTITQKKKHNSPEPYVIS